MANRFGDINRGPQLAQEYDALQTWRKKTAAEKRTAYNAVKKTSARVIVEKTSTYITPFAAARADIYYRTRVPAATQTGTGDEVAAAVRSAINGRHVLTLPGTATDTVIRVPKFKFAQVYATRRVGTPAPNAVSRLTGRPYTRVATETASGNFGQNATEKDYIAAVKAILAITAVKAFDDAAGQSIGFRPEGTLI